MARKWSYSTYGKSALGISLSVDGLDKLLEKVENAGKNIDEACENAVNTALPVIEESMKQGAARHRKGVGKYGTDEVYNAITSKPAKKEGNLIYGEVGVDVETHPKAMAAVFQEYGDGHSSCFPDPFIRPALDNNRTTVKKIMRNEIKKLAK